MTSFVNLIKKWQDTAGSSLTAEESKIRLPARDAARTAALSKMYPRRSEAELISELLTAVLVELEAAMPYIPGQKVVAGDEEGNLIYEDTSPTARFFELSRKHCCSVRGAAKSEDSVWRSL